MGHMGSGAQGAIGYRRYRVQGVWATLVLGIINPSCAVTNFSRSNYFAHILQMPLHVVVLYNQQTKVACGCTDQRFAVSRGTLHDHGKG